MKTLLRAHKSKHDIDAHWQEVWEKHGYIWIVEHSAPLVYDAETDYRMTSLATGVANTEIDTTGSRWYLGEKGTSWQWFEELTDGQEELTGSEAAPPAQEKEELS